MSLTIVTFYDKYNSESIGDDDDDNNDESHLGPSVQAQFAGTGEVWFRHAFNYYWQRYPVDTVCN
jgi:hypothetical protein